MIQTLYTISQKLSFYALLNVKLTGLWALLLWSNKAKCFTTKKCMKNLGCWLVEVYITYNMQYFYSLSWKESWFCILTMFFTVKTVLCTSPPPESEVCDVKEAYIRISSCLYPQTYSASGRNRTQVSRLQCQVLYTKPLRLKWK